MAIESSRSRFRSYRQRVRQRNAGRLAEVPPPAEGTEIAAPKSLGRSRDFHTLLVAFWGLLQGERRRIVLALMTLTVAVLLRLIPPAATKVAIDSVLSPQPLPLPPVLRDLPHPEDPLALLVVIALAVTVVSLAATAVHLWGRWLATLAVNRTQVSVRRRVFEHTIRLPLPAIYRIKSGGVASLIREDAGGVAELIFSMLYNPWRAIIQFVGSLIILTLVDWRLMLGGALLLPVVWVTHRTWINRIRPLYRDIRKQRQRIDAGATETFGGIRVVRTFARARSESGRFVRENDLMVRQQLFAWWWTRIIEVIWEVIIPLASTGLLLYGGYQILQGNLTLGDLMMFLIYLTMLLDPLATLAGSAVTFQNNLAGLDRILDILQQDREATAAGGGGTIVMPSQVQGRLELRGVNFRYPDTDVLVLRDIDLEIEAGQTVALVGRSGAGKTTLTNLIARFYQPTSGSLLLDGRHVSEIDLESYRQLLGIVEQDVFLFDGTIGENIAYARRGATLEQVRGAAEAAAATEFIDRLPEGFDTWVGERGVKLSGGQRQRLAIARAILADPRILILDEATSNLDSESERLIQQSLSRLLRGRTALVIAHRLSTIASADRIVVLDQGRILEVGSHAELLRRGGRYQEMLHLQTRPFESS
jgi:ATP-binding cassette, subfamily B, bacterial